jgi:hypothetical protein
MPVRWETLAGIFFSVLIGAQHLRTTEIEAFIRGGKRG